MKYLGGARNRRDSGATLPRTEKTLGHCFLRMGAEISFSAF